MRLKLLTLSLLLLPSVMMAQESKASLKVTEHQLSNGMTVWLNEDHSQPKVFGSVVVNAGSKDCPGTGIAHYFEHILFKGTDRIGTVDYQSEKVYLDSISAAYDKLAGTTDAQEREAIQKDINRLSGEAGEYAIPNEFNRLITRYGGSGLNAATSYDMTFYFNYFPSQYLEQWSRLYSERLLTPVYRLFQGELETVYEEKNRSADNPLSAVLDGVLESIFGTEPYGYPIIGTTENLKNPKQSEMEKFFKTYYVGCNMGIILCGDFDSATALEVLERNFGRIERGVKPVRKTSPFPSISGVNEVELKVPIPIISASANIYKAPTDYEPDAASVDIGLALLTNGSCGLLDSLMNESEVLAAMAMRQSMNDAGMSILLAVPNLLGKSKKAEAKIQEQLDRIKRGDFSDEMFEAVRLDAIRKAESSIETIADRAEVMVSVMSSGHSWQEYLDQVAHIRDVSRADVIAAMNKYFGGSYYHFKKKFGNTAKDKLKQPGYKPVRPKNIDTESDFARELAAIPTAAVADKAVDFDRDVTKTAIGSHVQLYSVQNPVNDIFNLDLSYRKGSNHDARLESLSTYLGKVGTESMTHQEWERRLYDLGVTCSFECGKNKFDISIAGPDQNLPQALSLVGELLTGAKHNSKALKDMIDEVKVEAGQFGNQNTDVVRSVIQKVSYGNNSSYLRKMTKKEVKSLTSDDMLSMLSDLLSTECVITYSGTQSAGDVAQAISASLPVDRCVKASSPVSYRLEPVSEPTVYVYDMPKSRQTYVCSYDYLPAMPQLSDKVRLSLLSEYLGGDMSSVLFQEMREFRSLCYNTQSMASGSPHNLHPDWPVGLVTITSTQSDKSMQATALLDSLLRDMPVRATNMEVCRQGYISDLRNSYPSFREMPEYVYASQLNGYSSDPSVLMSGIAQSSGTDDIKAFYDQRVKGNSGHRCYMIIGKKKDLDLKKLSQLGRVVFLKKGDVTRK